jgi:hypothetical protein
MAFHKFEQKIKETLGKRTIQPSKNAWNRLDSKLQGIETRKNKSIFWGIGIAASIIGILLVVVPLLFHNDIESTVPIIVDTKIIKTFDIENSINNNNELITEENLTDSEVLDTTISDRTASKEKRNFTVHKKQVSNTKSKELNMQMVQIEQFASLDKIVVMQEKVNPLTFQESEVKDLAVKTKHLTTQKNTITDADIEALLSQAQKELQLNQIYTETTNMVDANLLLQDVEVDLDKSFRKKVFEAFKINYENMITAVSERND